MSTTVVIKNLPLHIEPSRVSQYLWLTVGLDVPEQCIKVANLGSYSSTVFVALSEATLVEFLTRNLADKPLADRTLTFEVERKKQRA